MPNSFFHFLTRFESHDVFFRDFHRITGSGVSGLAGRSFLDFKDTKISQLDSGLPNESVDDGIESFLNDLFGLQLGKVEFLGDGFDDLFFGHVSDLPENQFGQDHILGE